jgi:DNA repair exonuclease SbcCD ATPase subunit
MVEFKLNDPVKVTQKNDAPLQGIIAYLGPVDFAEGDDWVGVRLTGDSVGRGKNDGSVHGKVYFSAAQENGGVFVRRANVSPWVLSKLEELRLKREIQGIGPSRSPSSTKVSSKDDDDVSIASMRSLATGASSKSRLEEIRARRMVLQQKNQLGMSPAPKNVIESKAMSRSLSSPSPLKSKSILPSTPSSIRRVTSASAMNMNKSMSSSISSEDMGKTTTIPSDSQEQSEIVLKLKQSEEQIASLTRTLQEQQKRHEEKVQEVERLKSQVLTISSENQKLQESLRVSEEASQNAQAIADRYKNAAKEAKKEAEDAITKSAAIGSDPKASKYLEEIATLTEQLVESRDEKENYARENSIMTERLNRALSQSESLQKKLEQEQESHETSLQNMREELSGARSKVSSLEKELAQKGDKAALREDNNASQYKERAKLQAEILSLQRQCQEMEKEKQELDKSVEDLVLDKEALQEKLELLEDKYEELKIDAESAQIEADELKLELDEARERAERLEATSVLKSVASDSQTDGLEHKDAEAEEVAQALSVQNARLREALLRLREQSNAEKMDLTKQIRSMEREYEAAKALKEELQKLQKNEIIMKEEIKDLKEMVDQGAAFEQMVEQMSERVIAVEENNLALQGMIRELEDASELSAEMEETQAEEIKALILDLQSRDTVVANLEEAIKM